jgi:hypothetical protein
MRDFHGLIPDRLRLEMSYADFFGVDGQALRRLLRGRRRQISTPGRCKELSQSTLLTDWDGCRREKENHDP